MAYAHARTHLQASIVAHRHHGVVARACLIPTLDDAIDERPLYAGEEGDYQRTKDGVSIVARRTNAMRPQRPAHAEVALYVERDDNPCEFRMMRPVSRP